MADVRITVSMFAFRARFERDAAPLTCARFESMLPCRERLIHVRFLLARQSAGTQSANRSPVARQAALSCLLPAGHPSRGPPFSLPGTGSHRTPRWREPDSNHRFRLRYSPWGSSLVVSADLSTLPSRKRSSQRTQRWRELDSNPRSPALTRIFRNAGTHGTRWPGAGTFARNR